MGGNMTMSAIQKVEVIETIDDVFARARVDGKLETSASNKALQDYCELGVARSLTKLHKQYVEQAEAIDNGDDSLDLPPSTSLKTIQNWSADFNFVSRASDYDRLIAEERVKLDAERRIAEREQRRNMLEKLRLQLEAMMAEKDLTADTKKFNAMVNGFKSYHTASMSEFNDLPQNRVDVTTKDEPISVSFITEPVAQSLVNDRLKELGLEDYAAETAEHDIEGLEYTHLELEA